MKLSPATLRSLAIALFAFLAGGVFFGVLSKKGTTPASVAESSSAPKKETYTCPMHPSIVSDHPGKCPICHMDLQKVDTDDATAQNAPVPGGKEKKILYYRHPMRGEITSPTPAKDEMGMDYVPVYADDEAGPSDSGVPGRSAFTLSAERQQLIGVATTKAVKKPMSYEVRASGTVAYDPDLYTAIEEYRQALTALKAMAGGDETLRRQSEALVESSRTKLKLMGLGDGQIRRVGASRASPMGLILPKGNVWIYAEVFEYELGGLKVDQPVEVTSPSAPGKTFTGKLGSISPVLNAQTRSVRVRALVPDPEGLLRPDSFVNVRIKVDLGERLTVPADAVLHSGDQDFVFVAKEKGRFEPRNVKVGAKANAEFEILSGLAEGDTVVSAANFLIDSESRLRGAVQPKATAPQSPRAPPSPTSGASSGKGPGAK